MLSTFAKIYRFTDLDLQSYGFAYLQIYIFTYYRFVDLHTLQIKRICRCTSLQIDQHRDFKDLQIHQILVGSVLSTLFDKMMILILQFNRHLVFPFIHAI